MKNLFQRTISGIIYLAVIIGSLFLGEYAYGALFLVVSLVALSEYYNLSGYPEFGNLSVIGIFAGVVSFLLLFLCASLVIPAVFSVLLLLVPVLFMIAGIYVKTDTSRGLAALFTGFLYISLPFAATSFIVFPEVVHNQYTHRILLGLLTLIWINDTGAYVSGMLFGRHRLFERISPKKSWEGFAGGTLFTIVAAFFMTPLMGILQRTDWIILAVIVCIFGVYGDLAESLLKRNSNVKDSGTIMPGHGGLLDRFDSMLFVVPVAVVYLFIRQFN